MFVLISRLNTKNLLAIDVEKQNVVELSFKTFYNEIKKNNVWGVENNKLVSYYSLPIVDIKNKIILKSNFDIYTLIAKKSNIGENKRYLVSNPFGELLFLSYAEVIDLIIRYGFTNLLRTERCIKSKQKEIILLPKNINDIKNEQKLFVFDKNNDIVFRNFIDNPNTSAKKYLGKYIKVKRPLNEVTVFADMTKFYDKIKAIQRKSFMNDILCDFCFVILDKAVKKGKEGYIEYLKEYFKNKDFLNYPCMICEDFQFISSFALLDGRGFGGVNVFAPYVLIFNKGTVGEDLGGLRVIYHEYCHYLSSNDGDTGFCIKLSKMDDEKYIRLLNFFEALIPKEDVKSVLHTFLGCLTEGMTDILAGFLLYEDAKFMWNNNKFVKEDGKTFESLVDVKKQYSPLLKDLKTLENIDFVFDFEERQKYSKCIDDSPYLNDILVVLLLMEKMSVEFMIYCYMENKFDLIFQNMIYCLGEKFVKELIYNFYNTDYKNIQNLGSPLELENEVVSIFKKVKKMRNLDNVYINYDKLFENEEIVEE